ncbi:hypothetical protein ABZ357_19505 [Streptomyces sp. NPDC005917]|uniref:hypothetical protein n=1 Tax=unclassified Streptomyces TaxID=2593676 RepID=UPI0033D0C589
MPTPSTPVVLIHGPWIHPSSRQSWTELLEESGYDPVATAWPGVAYTVEATRAPGHPTSTADEAVAQALEDTALSGDPARRTERLLRAAGHAVQLGRPEPVNRLLGRAQTATLSPRQHATVVWLRGILDEGLGGHPGSVVSPAALAEIVAADDPDRADPSGRSKG